MNEKWQDSLAWLQYTWWYEISRGFVMLVTKNSKASGALPQAPMGFQHSPIPQSWAWWVPTHSQQPHIFISWGEPCRETKICTVTVTVYIWTVLNSFKIACYSLQLWGLKVHCKPPTLNISLEGKGPARCMCRDTRGIGGGGGIKS